MTMLWSVYVSALLFTAAARTQLPIAIRPFAKTAANFAALFQLSQSVAFAVNPPQPETYFGVGCFWHVQHELVNAEKSLLGRDDGDITVRVLQRGLA